MLGIRKISTGLLAICDSSGVVHETLSGMSLS
jgi:hypothetical protein